MKYSKVIRARFLARPNRFVAKVEIDGHTETVHVKNTGRCREMLIPGAEVYLTAPGTPGRRTIYVSHEKSPGICCSVAIVEKRLRNFAIVASRRAGSIGLSK